MIFGGSVTSLKGHIWVWPGSGWSYQGFCQILREKIIIPLALMRFCEENQYKILLCIICGMNQTVGGGWVTSLSSFFWVYLGSWGGRYQRWNWLAWKTILLSIMMMILKAHRQSSSLPLYFRCLGVSWRGGADDVTIKPLLGLPGVWGGRISEVELTCIKNYFTINKDDEFESSPTIELTSNVF